MVNNIAVLFFIVAISLSLNGCAVMTSSNADELNEFDTLIANDQCKFTAVDKKINKNDDTILWSIQGGSLARNCGNFQKSIEYFDTAEYHYKYDVDIVNPAIKTARKTKTMFLNNNANPYEGNIYEKTMVNTYKGLNFLAINNIDNARVEFNRALERQSLAKEYFNKEITNQIEKINKEKQELDNAQSTYNQSNMEQISLNPNIKTIVKDKFIEKSGYSYPDFVNPFTTYISALFFFLDKNYNKSFDLFRENLQMDPKNHQILKDFSLANDFANSPALSRKSPKYIWLIYESGLGARKIETRIDLPVFIVTNSFYYTGIALPKLQYRQPSYQFLQIKNNSGKIDKTSVIADMDSVITAEFNKRFQLIATEAVLSSTAKTIAQKQINDYNELAGFLASIFQIYSTRADVRHWSALPKNFQAASIPIEDGNISILNENNVILFQDFVANEKNVIIYVKSSHIGQFIVHKIIF